MNKRRKFALSTAFLCGLPMVGAAWAMSSAGYTINWDVIAGGGGHASQGGYTVDGSAGQPVVGTLSGGSYSLAVGFWPGAGAETSTPTTTPTGTPTATATGSPPAASTPTTTTTPTQTPTSTPTVTGFPPPTATTTPTGTVTPLPSLIYLPMVSKSYP